MTITEIKNIADNFGNISAIYSFKNQLNNKYYIGQSIQLKRRIYAHLKHIDNLKYKQHIYKAFRQYDIENFEFNVVEIINPDNFNNKEELKQYLDQLEIKYIEQYNSYGINGYNQTKGGDPGVLGLKHSDEVKEHLRQINFQKELEKEKVPNNWVKALNIETNEIIYAKSKRKLAERIGVTLNIVKRGLRKNGGAKLSGNKFIIRKYNDGFPQNIDEYLNDINYYIGDIGIKGKIQSKVFKLFEQYSTNISLIKNLIKFIQLNE